uniref:Uncharacterized protein n=1 Tax=Octopus bimaculoides TaxID=37653 RepID=A0A0L8G2J9_OCTBM
MKLKEKKILFQFHIIAIYSHTCYKSVDFPASLYIHTHIYIYIHTQNNAKQYIVGNKYIHCLYSQQWAQSVLGGTLCLIREKCK